MERLGGLFLHAAMLGEGLERESFLKACLSISHAVLAG